VEDREDLEAKINAAWPNLKEGMTYLELEDEVGRRILSDSAREKMSDDQRSLLAALGVYFSDTFRIPMDNASLVLTFEQGRLISMERVRGMLPRTMNSSAVSGGTVHRTGEHASAARSRIEDLSYARATDANTPEALQIFLRNYPGGRHSQEARAKLAALAEQEALALAVRRGDDDVEAARQLLAAAGTEPSASPGSSAPGIKSTRLGLLTEPILGKAMSQDGRHLAFVTSRSDKMLVAVDARPGPEYDIIDRDSLVFSPDSRRLAYAAKRGQKEFVVVDTRPGPEYDIIGRDSLVFSPDSKRLAYVAKNSQKELVLLAISRVPKRRFGLRIQGRGASAARPETRRVSDGAENREKRSLGIRLRSNRGTPPALRLHQRRVQRVAGATDADGDGAPGARRTRVGDSGFG
jgi:hypothetical protein